MALCGVFMRFVLSVLVAANLLAQTASPGAKVLEAPLRAHLAFLSDDLLEGRGTGQRGAELTVRYLETQLQVLGLKPARGTAYRQPVALLGLRTRVEQSTLSFLGGGACTTPRFGSEMVYGSGVPNVEQTFDAPVVFVGFGIDAPEYQWDDYKGLDAHGKVLLMLVNEPAPTSAEPGLFDGLNLSKYGRWTTKFEMAARHGAAGVLLIHTTASASYGWPVVRNGWDAERFSLKNGSGGTPLQGWVTEDTARALAKQGGQGLDTLRAMAQGRDFRPVPLDLTLKGTLRSVARTIEQFNVAGVVPGNDPALRDELVIYTAHWDHLGIGKAPAGDTHPGHAVDTIYNGAVDNASGCAALLAMAQAAVLAPARRSQMFLFACAEEQGLLGSKAYVADPLWPLAKTAVDLNLDSISFVAPTRDVGLPFAPRPPHTANATTRSRMSTIPPGICAAWCSRPNSPSTWGRPSPTQPLGPPSRRSARFQTRSASRRGSALGPTWYARPPTHLRIDIMFHPDQAQLPIPLRWCQ